MFKRPRIVILGAGYGGLCVAHRLEQLTKPKDAEVILIDKNSYHANAICLHEVAMGNAAPQDICYDLVQVIKKPHVQVMKTTVESIDRETKIIQTSRGPIHYDILVIALGFVPETFGIKGMDKHAFQIESIAESEEISRHMEDQFRKYAFTDHIDRDPKDIAIIVGGSGFTGIELLGEIIDRVPILCKKYDINRDYVTIHCISADQKLLPMFSDDEVAQVKHFLETHGVTLTMPAFIKEATPESFKYTTADGQEHESFAHTLIWAGGVSGSPIMTQCFGDVARRGRLAVNQDLTAPGYDNIYIVGDCAVFTASGKERPEAPTAQIATQMGYHAAENIARQLKNRPRKPFHYIYRGTVCSLGAKYAVAHLGKRTVTGFFAMRLKRFIETVTDYKISGVYNAIKNTRVFKLINF